MALLNIPDVRRSPLTKATLLSIEKVIFSTLIPYSLILSYIYIIVLGVFGSVARGPSLCLTDVEVYFVLEHLFSIKRRSPIRN